MISKILERERGSWRERKQDSDLDESLIHLDNDGEKMATTDLNGFQVES